MISWTEWLFLPQEFMKQSPPPPPEGSTRVEWNGLLQTTFPDYKSTETDDKLLQAKYEDLVSSVTVYATDAW